MKSYNNWFLHSLQALAAGVVLSGMPGGSELYANFSSFVIREASGSNAPDILVNNDYVVGATEFIIDTASQKAGWGSNDINAHTVGQITKLNITRHDDTTRFNSGSGPAFAPYFNIWVTDGLGHFAVLANEPTNPAFQALFTASTHGAHTDHTYDLSFSDLSSHPVQVFETANGGYGSTTTWVHNLLNKNYQLTFADVAGLTILPPSPAYITGPNNVGSGAPRELGTNTAYGFNWVFGDTLSNYVSGDDGYIVSDPMAIAIPEPGTLALTRIAVIGFACFASRRKRRLSAKAAT
jgi:hypothetical protein